MHMHPLVHIYSITHAHNHTPFRACMGMLVCGTFNTARPYCTEDLGVLVRVV